MINKLKINLLQYVLVGFALSVFFILLLSFSEYVGFEFAYLIASLATIGLITSFISGIIKNKKVVFVVFSILIALYLYIYIIIQLKEGALLIGSIGLFIILAVLMYFSKKIEWSK